MLGVEGKGMEDRLDGMVRSPKSKRMMKTNDGGTLSSTSYLNTI